MSAVKPGMSFSNSNLIIDRDNFERLLQELVCSLFLEYIIKKIIIQKELLEKKKAEIKNNNTALLGLFQANLIKKSSDNERS